MRPEPTTATERTKSYPHISTSPPVAWIAGILTRMITHILVFLGGGHHDDHLYGTEGASNCFSLRIPRARSPRPERVHLFVQRNDLFGCVRIAARDAVGEPRAEHQDPTRESLDGDVDADLASVAGAFEQVEQSATGLVLFRFECRDDVGAGVIAPTARMKPVACRSASSYVELSGFSLAVIVEIGSTDGGAPAILVSHRIRGGRGP